MLHFYDFETVPIVWYFFSFYVLGVSILALFLQYFGFTPGFVNCKKGCTWLAVACDKVYQFLAHGRWFSPGTPASSTIKTGRHDITEILLKVALNTKNQNQIIYYFFPSLGIRYPSSVNFSHFNLLLWNPSAKWTETWKEGPL